MDGEKTFQDVGQDKRSIVEAMFYFPGGLKVALCLVDIICPNVRTKLAGKAVLCDQKLARTISESLPALGKPYLGIGRKSCRCFSSDQYLLDALYFFFP